MRYRNTVLVQSSGYFQSTVSYIRSKQCLINSNMTLTVLNLHQKIDPKVQQDFKGQGHYDKVKSRSHHDAAHLHPLTNVPSKHQLPTPYGFRDIARTRFSNSRSVRQGQRSNQGQTMTLHTYTS